MDDNFFIKDRKEKITKVDIESFDEFVEIHYLKRPTKPLKDKPLDQALKKIEQDNAFKRHYNKDIKEDI